MTMTRGLQKKDDKMVWIMLIGAVSVIICVCMFAPAKHKTHSAGDYGVPTFQNGGEYKDGTRQAKSNSNNNNAYRAPPKPPGSGISLITLILCGLAVYLFLYLSGFLSKTDISCNGKCCAIRPDGSS